MPEKHSCELRVCQSSPISSTLVHSSALKLLKSTRIHVFSYFPQVATALYTVQAALQTDLELRVFGLQYLNFHGDVEINSD